jgi:hypothetical protein
LLPELLVPDHRHVGVVRHWDGLDRRLDVVLVEQVQEKRAAGVVRTGADVAELRADEDVPRSEMGG